MSKETQTDKLNCSFCGKVQDEVKKLIAGPSVYICNECVDLCNDIIEEEIKNDEESPYDQSLSCLLYTSPSPRDSCASRMPSAA